MTSLGRFNASSLLIFQVILSIDIVNVIFEHLL
jgi:hypothetical protein